MPAQYRTILTTLGQAAIANAIANASTVNLLNMAVGDGNGNPTTPAANQTALVREKYRTTINSLNTDPNNPNYVVAEMVVPSNVGGWTVHEFGIFDNAGTMIAVGNFPATYKPVIAEGSTRDLIIRVVFEVADAEAVELVVDPAVVIATRQWVADNFSLAFQIPGGTTGMVLRKASNADGDVEWYDPLSGLNITVDVVEETQTLAASQTAVSLAVASTVGVSLYVDGVRLRSDEFTIVDETDLTLAVAYPAGSKLTAVQNEPNASPEFLRSNANLTDLPNKEAARTALELLTNDTYLTALWKKMCERQYPIGEILITRQSANPATYMGFGTWELYGPGRTLVGFNAGDSDFNALDKNGGAKTHTLVAAELPGHTHTVPSQSITTAAAGGHNHFAVAIGQNGTGLAAGDGKALSNVSNFASGNVDYSLFASDATPTTGVTSSVAGHTHTATIPSIVTSSSGSNQGHNNLQPYITVYFWKRTA
jgi:microcystin-dependent protein